jgi:3-dehydroshikimate dehydratase
MGGDLFRENRREVRIMKISLCTISFRHELVSLPDLARWAGENHFDGIELWGVHALKLHDTPARSLEIARAHGVAFSMLSDYFALHCDEARVMRRAEQIFRIARQMEVGKVRTFAGGRPSREMDEHDREEVCRRLRKLCEAAGDLKLVVEIHPNTLAETLESTLELIERVDHPALRINFDVLHVWESGADPVDAFRRLRGHVAHLHLKNVRSRRDLAVFDPANVYSASGNREGMTPLFEGVYDYERFLSEITPDDDLDASLEWFGDNAREVLKADRLRLANARGLAVV